MISSKASSRFDAYCNKIVYDISLSWFLYYYACTHTESSYINKRLVINIGLVVNILYV